jgi:hypothetical protein
LVMADHLLLRGAVSKTRQEWMSQMQRLVHHSSNH